MANLAEGGSHSTLHGIVFPRLLVGLVVLICAEVFSGASVQVGLWSPWTWLVTYWLSFAHFFLFTSLAVKTGRTSLWSLYLWGVLFGLYESWITKVIWHGYGGDGQLVFGAIGPYGYGEISMVFFFHPLLSFILPLAVVCLLCPPLRGQFPDLAWFTGTSRGARGFQAWLVISFASILAMNSGGIVNLGANWAIAFLLLLVLYRLARPALSSLDGREVLVFGTGGLVGLGIYMGLLYSVTYFVLNPQGLPSSTVQALTFLFYAATVLGLIRHRKRDPLVSGIAIGEGEIGLVKLLFLLIIASSLVLSTATSIIIGAIFLNMLAWTPIGIFLTAVAVLRG
jgi:hypothetical protein